MFLNRCATWNGNTKTSVNTELLLPRCSSSQVTAHQRASILGYRKCNLGAPGARLSKLNLI